MTQASVTEIDDAGEAKSVWVDEDVLGAWIGVKRYG
jgi:hypothetical protein